MVNRMDHKWVVDECPDAYGNWTIRIADGSNNGNTEEEPVATVYGLSLAESIVDNHNRKFQ